MAAVASVAPLILARLASLSLVALMGLLVGSYIVRSFDIRHRTALWMPLRLISEDLYRIAIG
jgi:hypothetical protein